jgi:predicted dehydrogenase
MPPGPTAADRPLRVALLGFGLGGAAFHAPLVAATRGLALAAIVTRDPTRAAQARAAHPAAAILPDADAVWRDAAAYDAVIVTTPNRTHAPLALAAIAAGLPTVVDKPLARTADEARAVVEAARARGVPLTVYQNRRWDGDFCTVRRLVAEGALGDVLRLESRFERWRPVPKGGWREAGTAAEEGGGILLDLGAHVVDQARHLLGPVTHVYAEVERRRAGIASDDDAFVALTHAGGVRSHCWLSLVAAQGGPRFRVLGSRGAYVKSGTDPQEAALRGGTARPGSAGWGEEPEAAWGRLGSDEAARAVRTEPGDWPAFYRAWERTLRTGAPVPVDPDDAVATLAILDAARRSSATGAVVAMRGEG